MTDEIKRAPASTARRGVVLGLAAAMAAPLAHAQPAALALNREEQDAIALIRSWVAALVAKDAEMAVSMMDEACQYRDDPFQTELKKGRENVRKDFQILLRGLTSMKIEAIYAVGSPKNDVLVLVRRLDAFTLGGKQIAIPMGAYYRVRNGKILEWLDTPLEEMPPAPPGSPPLG